MIELVKSLFARRQGVRWPSADAEARVSLGAGFLDDASPGWHRKVDTDKVDLFSASKCVLGQVYGSFTRGIHLSGFYGYAGGVGRNIGDYGFATKGIGYGDLEAEADDLKLAWRLAVETRRAADDVAGETA